MILVVGGYDEDIAAYVEKALGYGREMCAVGALDEAPCVLQAQDLVQETIAESVVHELLRREVVGLREVGCGVVPLDARDRAWREAVGGLGRALAAQASSVVRVTCGLPQVIKGVTP